MASQVQTIPSEEAGVRWTLRPAERARSREDAKKFVLHAALHILLHSIAYVLFFTLALHFLMPGIFSIRAAVLFILHILFRSWPAFVAFIPAVGLILWGFYALQLLPISFEIDDSLVGWKDWTGSHLYAWRRFKAYRIDSDPKWPGLRTLKLKTGLSFGSKWPFDPTEVDEQEVRRLFEEHGVPDAGAGPWYGSKKREAG